MAEADDENRPDIDRQKIEPVRRGDADRAIIGPGSAIYSEAERINERSSPPRDIFPPAVVAPPGDEKQQDDISDRGGEHRRPRQHRRPPRSRLGRRTAPAGRKANRRGLEEVNTAGLP